MFCQSQAYPAENNPEKSQIFLTFLFPKKAKVFKKSQNFKIWLQKIQIGNSATKELRMRMKCAGKLAIFCCVQMSSKL